MKSNKGYFIIGTDTDIGKTYISSLLYRSCLSKNPSYYKPIQTGCYEKDGSFIALDPEFLCKFSNIDYNPNMSSYLYKNPLSPHLASEIENYEIDPNLIKLKWKEMSSHHPINFVEAAGGIYVPILRNKFYMYDLVKLLNLPVILVSSSKVGSINHAMLTISFLKSQKIEIQGIIFNNYTDEFYEKDNIKVITECSNISNYLTVAPGQQIISEKDLNKFLGGY